MLKAIKHVFNILKASTRDLIVPKKRSSLWRKVEKEFLEENSECAACGSKNRLNVHHIKPFHLFPELELEKSNLITLCMSKNECHLRLGHGSNFKSYCPEIKKYAKQIHNKEKTFEELYNLAKENRKD